MLKRLLSTTSIKRFPDSAHPHRTRLTNLLWRERYAKGQIDKHGIPLLGQATDDKQPYVPQPKLMKDSYSEVILPFRSDLLLREEYVNYFRGLRFGKLMEDLDALAASIAYKHAHDGRDGFLPLTIVTASVDRMDLFQKLRPDLDLRLSGCVTFVGRSSMEVTIRMESLGDLNDSAIDETTAPVKGNWTPICLGRFTMVAKKDGKSVQVNPLVMDETAREFQADGERRKAQKLEHAQQDLRKQVPTDQERRLIHSLWLELTGYDGDIPADVTLMKNTKLSTVKLAHPQERNIHSSIFGGFLMKEAFELAYTNAMLFIKGRPYTVSLDEVSFRRPVPIGSIIILTSQVVYAEGEPHRTFQVSVTAEILSDVKTDMREVSNVFHYTFARGKNKEEGGDEDTSVNRILPESYSEAMTYVQGQRRKIIGIAMKKAQLDEFVRFRELNSTTESSSNFTLT